MTGENFDRRAICPSSASTAERPIIWVLPSSFAICGIQAGFWRREKPRFRLCCTWSARNSVSEDAQDAQT